MKCFRCGLFLAGLLVLTLGESWSADDKAGPKGNLKPGAKKKLAEFKKKQELEKSAKEAKKASESKKTFAESKESPVLTPLVPKRIGGSSANPVAVAQFIDSQIQIQLDADKEERAPRSGDAEFLRRVSLDITGVIPTADRARKFLADTTPNKRELLIDELLASKKFADHQADHWYNQLIQKSSDQRRVDFESFRTWTAEQFNKNRTWDKIVSDYIIASGNQEKNPAVGFYLSNNTVDKMTDEVCKTFLGVQLQCAQCHNHPFTAWKQTEYWAMAQFFMHTEIGGLGKDATPSVKESAKVKRGKMNQLPELHKDVPARFLQSTTPALGGAIELRPTLAKWVTSPTNPFFAKAMVNRTWAQFFGRGFVNPIDDLHEGNEASHPALLNALAADFSANGFDVKHLVKAICLTEAYQRTSQTTEPTGEELDYGRMMVKVLTPEQLYDSLQQVTKFTSEGKGMREKNMKGVPPNSRGGFINFFLAGAEQANTTEYEAGIPQALKLMNSRVTVNPAIVKSIVDGKTGREAIENLFLTCLTRQPTAAEVERFTKHVSGAATTTEAYSDILWVLLNSSEFTLNH
ncbi:MAG: DUF1549 and DUF1553 domain-containing protein [Gemmataceae bacterium]